MKAKAKNLSREELLQRIWIGRSDGAEVHFKIADSGETLTVFTTRPDTLFGATYMVLSPEHKLVDAIATTATATITIIATTLKNGGT